MLKIHILLLTGVASGLLVQYSFTVVCGVFVLFVFICIHLFSNPQTMSARGTLAVAPVSSEPPGWSIREQMSSLVSQGILLAPQSHL